MINVGEQLVSSYLRHIRHCDVVDMNVTTIESQGEIDVVGWNLKVNRVYVCEVAIHLTTGLQYTKDNRPNNVQKLTDKFSRDIEHAHKYMAKYEQHFMLWSPIVKDSKGKLIYNQLRHVKKIQANIKERYDVEIDCIVNERFQECLGELRNFAKTQTKELQCPVMRYIQIEEYLSKHVAKLG